MMYVALSLAACVVVQAVVFAQTCRRQSRAHHRAEQAWTAERGHLLDRLMMLAGNPWTLPPAPPAPTVHAEPDPDDELDLVADPAQQPDW